MKIIINATNIIEDRPLREVDRLITMGKAHLPEVKPEPVKTYNGYVQSEKPEITFEDLNDTAIFREPAIEVDVIEPIPIDHYVDFKEIGVDIKKLDAGLMEATTKLAKAGGSKKTKTKL